MGKFKVGDRVKRVRDGINKAIEGHVYEVSGLRDDSAITLKGHGLYTYNAQNFELATPFTINPGDYIDSREFSREECERFCELAVECGHSDRYADFSGVWVLHGVSADGELISCHDGDSVCRNNITSQFREFLNKEKGMSQENNIKAAELICDKLQSGQLITLSIDGINFTATADGFSIESDPCGKRFTLDDLSIDITPESKVKEMNVADIERELGYSVKVVK